jgi:hypothetical protein
MRTLFKRGLYGLHALGCEGDHKKASDKVDTGATGLSYHGALACSHLVHLGLVRVTGRPAQTSM